MKPNIPSLEPVPMVKEKTVKDDGRFLYYYTFPQDHAPEPPTEQKEERANDDV